MDIHDNLSDPNIRTSQLLNGLQAAIFAYTDIAEACAKGEITHEDHLELQQPALDLIIGLSVEIDQRMKAETARFN